MFLSAEAQPAVIQRWSANPGLDAGTTEQRSTPARVDAAAAKRTLAIADDHPDVVAAERALTAAETFGAASAAPTSHRAQALTVAGQEASAAVRTAADASEASETSDSASKAAATAFEAPRAPPPAPKR